jgi:hypothetical protein
VARRWRLWPYQVRCSTQQIMFCSTQTRYVNVFPHKYEYLKEPLSRQIFLCTYLVSPIWDTCQTHSNPDFTTITILGDLCKSQSSLLYTSSIPSEVQLFLSELFICHICMCLSSTFLTKIYPPKLGSSLYMEYYIYKKRSSVREKSHSSVRENL